MVRVAGESAPRKQPSDRQVTRGSAPTVLYGGLYDFEARAPSRDDNQRPRRLDLVARHENVWSTCTSRASERGKVGYNRRCNCAPNAGLHISPLLDRDLIPLTPVATACL